MFSGWLWQERVLTSSLRLVAFCTNYHIPILGVKKWRNEKAKTAQVYASRSWWSLARTERPVTPKLETALGVPVSPKALLALLLTLEHE